MTILLILYVASFTLPLLLPSWRVAVMALGVQGLLLAMIMAAGHGPWSWQMTSEFAALLAIRTFFVPGYLLKRMHGHDTDAEFSLVPHRMSRWLMVLGILTLAFFFGNRMCPEDPDEAMQAGAAAGAILIGLMVLANQDHPLGQSIGLFIFEGGVTLTELLSPHAMPFPVQVGLSVVSVFLVLVCGQYLSRIMALDNREMTGKELG